MHRRTARFGFGPHALCPHERALSHGLALAIVGKPRCRIVGFVVEMEKANLNFCKAPHEKALGVCKVLPFRGVRKEMRLAEHRECAYIAMVLYFEAGFKRGVLSLS